MQITETVKENLRREFNIKMSAADLEKRLTGRLTELQPQVHLKGFRPGKAPVSFLKKTYGKSVMGEIVEKAVSETSEETIKKHELKPAAPPRVELVGQIEPVIEGKADLEFTIKVDLMPEFDVSKLEELKVERLTADVTDADVDEALKRFADSQKTYEDKGAGATAEKGDTVTIDFEGKLDGVPFDGGKAEGFDLTLGSGAFIPGFEEQLEGMKTGDEKVINVTFPENYGQETLAGKPVTFDIKLHAVKAPKPAELNDEMAKKLGLESLDQLKERLRENLKAEYGIASRGHMKRRLLDALDKAHSFELPPGMVDAEFSGIWRQVEQELKNEANDSEDKDKPEEELKKEYREIAERRVRLGLVLAKVGEQNAIKVTQEEINRALANRARQFPGQEQQVVQYYANNPGAIEELRVPLFEDKVIDFIAQLAQVSDRPVDKDILFLDPDTAAEKLEGGSDEGEKKPKAKKKKG